MAHIGTLEVERETIIVLYDPDTGDIAHIHQTLTMKDGTHPDPKAIERDAREQLAMMQPRLDRKLEVLDVDPETVRSGGPYRVDVRKRVVVDAGPEAA
jgi:hypothetical protein